MEAPQEEVAVGAGEERVGVEVLIMSKTLRDGFGAADIGETA